jgi:hypothetical protein
MSKRHWIFQLKIFLFISGSHWKPQASLTITIFFLSKGQALPTIAMEVLWMYYFLFSENKQNINKITNISDITRRPVFYSEQS